MAFMRWQKLAEEVMGEMEQITGKHFCAHESVAQIQSTVARFYSVPMHLLTAEVRIANVALARQVAMFMSRKLTRLSQTEIGECFRRGHGTVNWACGAIEDRRTAEPQFAQTLTQIERLCAAAIKKNEVETNT